MHGTANTKAVVTHLFKLQAASHNKCGSCDWGTAQSYQIHIFLPTAQSCKFNVVVVVFLIKANAIARAPVGPSPWCLMSICSRVMCSRTKETGMIPSCEHASR